MPLTAKGEKVMKAMKETYGSGKKAEKVFYASRNKGVIKGVDPESSDQSLNWAGGQHEEHTSGPGDPGRMDTSERHVAGVDANHSRNRQEGRDADDPITEHEKKTYPAKTLAIARKTGRAPWSIHPGIKIPKGGDLGKKDAKDMADADACVDAAFDASARALRRGGLADAIRTPRATDAKKPNFGTTSYGIKRSKEWDKHENRLKQKKTESQRVRSSYRRLGEKMR